MAEQTETKPAVKTENEDATNGGETGGFQRGRGRGSRFSGGGRGGPQNRGDGRDGGNQNHRNDGGDFRGRRGGGGRGGGGRGGFRRGGDNAGPGGEGQEGEVGDGMGFRGRGGFDNIQAKINSFQGPTYDLPAIDMTEKKFNGRSRLYVGNIGTDVTEEDITELFSKFGETAELFINKDKNFGFIKLDYYNNAEKAKRELDGTTIKGRNLKIRFAPNNASIKVKNLSAYVTNELLHVAFSPFGEIEKVQVSVDERGRPTGEGYVHFVRKGSANIAIKKCQEGCYFLTSTLQPVIVEPYEVIDDNDGYSDKSINKKNPEFQKEREQPPRLAHPSSFDYEYGQRWKVLYELHQQKEEALKKELQLEKEKLIAQMEYAKYEHETEMLRNQLRAREMDKERQKREWEMKERMAEEERMRQEEFMKRSQEEMEARMLASQEDMRRRQQESNLFMQAHNLDSLLDQQEQAYDQPSTGGYHDSNRGDAGGVDMDPKQFMSSYERGHSGGGSGGGVRSNDGRDGGGYSRDRGSNSRGHWVSDNRRSNPDDYQSKRRRF